MLQRREPALPPAWPPRAGPSAAGSRRKRSAPAPQPSRQARESAPSTTTPHRQWGLRGGQGLVAGGAVGPIIRFVDAASPAAMPTPTPATEPAPIAPIAPMAPVAPDSPRVVATSDVD